MRTTSTTIRADEAFLGGGDYSWHGTSYALSDQITKYKKYIKNKNKTGASVISLCELVYYKF